MTFSWQDLISISVGLLAAVYLGWRAWRFFAGAKSGSCGSACSGCSSSSASVDGKPLVNLKIEPQRPL